MKIKFIFTIILIAMIGLLLLERSCVSNKLKKSIEAHDKLKISTDAGHKAADQAKIKQEKEKKLLQAEIVTLTRSVAARDLADADAGTEEKLEELEEEEPELEDKDLKIKNLREQNTLLRRQRDTAWATIVDIGKPIFSLSPTGKEIIEYPEGSVTDKLNKRFLAQVDLTVIETGKFNAERILRISADGVAEDAIKEAAGIKLGSDIKTYGVIILGVVVVVSIFKK